MRAPKCSASSCSSVADGAAPADIVSEVYRLKSGTAVVADGAGGTPVEKAAYHKNELTHLEDLRRRVQAGETGLDDFAIDDNPGPRQAELLRDVDALVRGASLDVNSRMTAAPRRATRAVTVHLARLKRLNSSGAVNVR
jgi:hypothetical protein